MDSTGYIKYYMPNDHSPYENNYLMQIDDKGNCYLYATIPRMIYGSERSKYYSSSGKFDIIKYLLDENENLLRQNYPKAVSFLYTLFQYLNNNGSVIEGKSLLETIAALYKDLNSDVPDRYNDVRRISEIINSSGITYIKTDNKQPVKVNTLEAQHDSRLKLSYFNGNAKINVLNGIKIGSNKIWNDVNYILLDRTTGRIIFNYDNQYLKKMPVHSQIL